MGQFIASLSWVVPKAQGALECLQKTKILGEVW